MLCGDKVEIEDGTTLRVKATFKDYDDVLIDPTNPTCKILDSTTCYATSTMTYLTTGVYYSDIAMSTLNNITVGPYIIEINATFASYPIVSRDVISVVKTGEE
jgi:hypothetical protein